MTITISEDLKDQLQNQALQRRTTVEELVHAALVWYLQTDPALLDELDAWQEVRDEAWGAIEESNNK